MEKTSKHRQQVKALLTDWSVWLIIATFILIEVMCLTGWGVSGR